MHQSWQAKWRNTILRSSENKIEKAEIDTADYITQARDDREELVSNKFLHKGKAGGLQFE
jgi:hypothetical protein